MGYYLLTLSKTSYFSRILGLPILIIQAALHSTRAKNKFSLWALGALVSGVSQLHFRLSTRACMPSSKGRTLWGGINQFLLDRAGIFLGTFSEEELVWELRRQCMEHALKFTSGAEEPAVSTASQMRNSWSQGIPPL